MISFERVDFESSNLVGSVFANVSGNKGRSKKDALNSSKRFLKIFEVPSSQIELSDCVRRRRMTVFLVIPSRTERVRDVIS
jgi:hypothetical protein